MSKKIKAAAKVEDREILKSWQQRIVNHLYWVEASTPDGSGPTMVQKWQSFVNHVMDIHEGHGELFQHCLHQTATQLPESETLNKKWIQPSTRMDE